MSKLQGPITRADGRARFSIGVGVPVDPVHFRGLLVEADGTVFAEEDTGQIRVKNTEGLSVSTDGRLIIDTGLVVAPVTLPGALQASASGALYTADLAPELIWQGVGMDETGVLSYSSLALVLAILTVWIQDVITPLNLAFT